MPFGHCSLNRVVWLPTCPAGFIKHQHSSKGMLCFCRVQSSAAQSFNHYSWKKYCALWWSRPETSTITSITILSMYQIPSNWEATMMSWGFSMATILSFHLKHLSLSLWFLQASPKEVLWNKVSQEKENSHRNSSLKECYPMLDPRNIRAATISFSHVLPRWMMWIPSTVRRKI